MPVKDELTGDPVDGGGAASEVEVLSPESLQQPSLASWDLQTAKSPQALYTPPDINSKLCSSSNYAVFCHSKDLQCRHTVFMCVRYCQRSLSHGGVVPTKQCHARRRSGRWRTS